jgi:hypothetical protein
METTRAATAGTSSTWRRCGEQPDNTLAARKGYQEEIPITSLDDNNVEEAASRYFSQGLFLMDEQLRLMHPSQCLDAALENEDQVVTVVSRDALQNVEMTGKRKAIDEPNPRPRKFIVTRWISSLV